MNAGHHGLTAQSITLHIAKKAGMSNKEAFGLRWLYSSYDGHPALQPQNRMKNTYRLNETVTYKRTPYRNLRLHLQKKT